jgi:hypothetical protein
MDLSAASISDGSIIYSEDGGSKFFRKIYAYFAFHTVPLASQDTAIASPFYEMQDVLVQTFRLFIIF